MKLSVICPTNRPGGLDVLCSGLARQTFRDFELVIADGLYPWRRRNLTPLTYQGFPVAHLDVPQFGGYQASVNRAILQCRGDVVLFVPDYFWLHEDALAVHAENTRPGIVTLGTFTAVNVEPAIHPHFPRTFGWYAMGHNPGLHADASNVDSYRPWLDAEQRVKLLTEWRLAFTRDIKAGKLDRFMWSTFDEPVTPDTDVAARFAEFHPGRVASIQPGPVHKDWCSLKNDSIDRLDLLSVNGMNEDMDRCHGHQDSELAGRLSAQAGASFRFVPEARGVFCDPHGIAILRGLDAPEEDNLRRYNDASDRGFAVRNKNGLNKE